MPSALSSKDTMARSSSLNNIEISPRTPINSRANHISDRLENDAEEGMEMSLLAEDERRQAARGTDGYENDHPGEHKGPISTKDKRAMALLCVLCELSMSLVAPAS